MANVSAMQGCSSHVTYLKSTDEKRRHPAHCAYARGKGKNRKCGCYESWFYNNPCKGSRARFCPSYKENLTENGIKTVVLSKEKEVI